MVASLRQAEELTGNPPDGGGQTGYSAGDRIETARLLLRPFKFDDLDDLYEITREPDVMRHIGDGHPLTRTETGKNLALIISALQRRGFGRLALVLKETGALVGYCGLSVGIQEVGVELAYLLAKSAWGKGLATEAGAACLRYGFENLGLDTIAALTRPDNAKSRRVMERLNMKYLRASHYHGYSCVWYSISRADWRPDRSLYRVIR